jgi:hypothetical protein
MVDVLDAGMTDLWTMCHHHRSSGEWVTNAFIAHPEKSPEPIAASEVRMRP